MGKAHLQSQPLPDDGHQHVCQHCDSDLSLHRVLADAVERLDPQVLVDPLEEQFEEGHQLHPNRAVSANAFASPILITHGLDREFELVAWHQSWGGDRVYIHDDAGRLCSFPASFTSLGPPDPFVMTAAGRSYFRVEDLIQLSELVERLRA